MRRGGGERRRGRVGRRCRCGDLKLAIDPVRSWTLQRRRALIPSPRFREGMSIRYRQGASPTLVPVALWLVLPLVLIGELLPATLVPVALWLVLPAVPGVVQPVLLLLTLVPVALWVVLPPLVGGATGVFWANAALASVAANRPAAPYFQMPLILRSPCCAGTQTGSVPGA